MSKRKFRVKLKPAHDKTGLSGYAVAQKIGIAQNTVRRYVDEPEVIVDTIPMTVIKLAEFYGYSWENIQEVVEVIEEEEDGEESPEKETPLAATA